jgi:hypothetical protein
MAMAEYQRIEYRINKAGKVVETVLDAAGASCTAATSAIEQALGQVESQEFLPAYYEGEEVVLEETQSSNCHE